MGTLAETTLPIFTKFSGIVYSGSIKIILMPPILRRKTRKTVKICSKFQGLTQMFDNIVKTVLDNNYSNLKQTN